MKDDEKAMLREIASHGAHARFGALPHLCGPIHPNRVMFILEKWSRKGWWEYGTGVRSGWLTEEGIRRANEIT